jgi:signal peptidase II
MLRKILLLVGIDQITKVIFASRDFFFGPVKISMVKNFGLPFNIQTSSKVSLLIVAACLILLVGYFYVKQEKFTKLQSLGLSLVFAGAIGNIIDRVFLGHVRDFIDLGLGFVFNFADVIIVLGLVLLFVPEKKQ